MSRTKKEIKRHEGRYNVYPTGYHNGTDAFGTMPKEQGDFIISNIKHDVEYFVGKDGDRTLCLDVAEFDCIHAEFKLVGDQYEYTFSPAFQRYITEKVCEDFNHKA